MRTSELTGSNPGDVLVFSQIAVIPVCLLFIEGEEGGGGLSEYIWPITRHEILHGNILEDIVFFQMQTHK